MNYESVLSVILSAAERASQCILEIYHTDFSSSVTFKADESPLTLADTAANGVICRMLREAYPEIPILSEENSHAGIPLDAEYCFIVDPLDGTKEFIKKNGEFTVNIALVQDHEPVLGVVAVPLTGEVFYAVKDCGAWMYTTGIGERESERLCVSAKTSGLILVGSKSHASGKEQALIDAHAAGIREAISAGSSLKGIMVARGTADVYYRFGPTCEWDTAAMHCIAEEAGGIVRQMDGTALRYHRENHLNEKGFYIVNREENIWV